MKRFVAAATLGLLLAAGTLAGCQKPAAKAETRTMPDVKAGIVVTGGRLVLPAVPGRPGAFYFTVANAGTEPARIAGVEVEHAGKTEMHETTGTGMKPLAVLRLEPGQVATFEPGARHVMVFDIDPTLKAGQNIDFTLHFVSGRVFNSQGVIQSAGAPSGDIHAMSGMDHSMNMGGSH